MHRLAFLVIVTLLTHRARAADDVSTAREHFEKGVAYAQSGDTLAATREFEEAYRLRPHFSVLYNLGHAYLLTARPVQALDAFTRYLQAGGDAIDAHRKAQVEAALLDVRKQVGSLKVSVQPTSSTLEIDGVQVTSDWQNSPVALASGRHSVIVQAEGYLPAARSVLVDREKPLVLELELEPMKPAADAAPERPSSAAASQTQERSAGASAVSLAYVSDHQQRADSRRTWAYVLGASGLVLGGAAVTFYALGAKQFREYEADKTRLNQQRTVGDYGRHAQQVQDDALAVQRFEHLTLGSAMLGAGLLGTGLFFYLTSEDPKQYQLPRASASANSVELNWASTW